MTKTFGINVPADFEVSAAVCSYGWALLSPNRWIKAAGSGRGAFERYLHTHNNTCIVVATVSQTAGHRIKVDLDKEASERDVVQLRRQIVRMLRLSPEDGEAVREFQERHAASRGKGFGRLLRAPTVWEDVVKCILLCNCGWGRTVSMNLALCQRVGQGAFPTATQVASWLPEKLQKECGLGYRARHLVKLAQQVSSREVDLEALEDAALGEDELLKKLRALPGLGPFSAANMLQLLGRYSRIPCDTETVRHLQMRHGLPSCAAASVQKHAEKVYEEYAPYQFLAYWSELWTEYEKLLGPIAELDPEQYSSFTGSNMRKNGRRADGTSPEDNVQHQNKRQRRARAS